MVDLEGASRARRFEDRVVVVAGTGPGVGRATALRFGLEGAKVVCAARQRQHLDQVSEAFSERGMEATCVLADVATADGARSVLSAAARRGGALDVLVVTAGSFEGGGADDADLDRLERMLDANLRAAYRLSLAALPHLERGRNPAVVVTTAVYGAVVPGPGLLAYNTSKAAATGFVRSLAGDFRHRNVRVNAVLPGGVTHRFDPHLDPARERRLDRGPAHPQDIAAAICFLASEEACFVTGATLVVDGGFAVSRPPA